MEKLFNIFVRKLKKKLNFKNLIFHQYKMIKKIIFIYISIIIYFGIKKKY